MSRTSDPWRHLLQVALLVTFALAARGQENVLLVIADDLGVDVVGAYGEGAAPPPTPNIDRLANEGVLFRNAWAYPSCSPTRAAILTGRHPFRTLIGIWIRYPNNANPVVGTLRSEEWTIPELLDLSGGGYEHACIGKWHLHDASQGIETPRALGGFDHYAGALTGEISDYFRWSRVVDGIEGPMTTYATTQTTDDALAWIQGRTGPWFCQVSYNAPHVPLHEPPPHLHTRTLTATSSNREKYKAMIEALDTEIGRLLAGIPQATLDDTHVLFLGDNGSVQTLAEPPFLPDRAKGTAYEGGVNVPLIYRGPATVAPGREVSAVTCAVDLFATVLDLTGATSAVPPWVATDSVSLVPYLGDPTQGPVRTFAFTEQFFGNAWPEPNVNGHATVRNARYKLVHRYTSFHELYDLELDPFESLNILTRSLSASERQNYRDLLDHIAQLRSPTARCVTFGAGCPGAAGVPRIGCVSPPRLARPFEVTASGAAPNAFAMLAMGESHTRFGTDELPVDLAAYGAGAGCLLLLSPDATFQTIADPVGDATLTFQIPSTPALMETTRFFGWFVFEDGSAQNPIGLVTSDALAAVVGL